MTIEAAAFLRDSLVRRGFLMTVADGLLYVAPRASLTDEDTQRIRECKPALLRLLTAPDDYPARMREQLKAAPVPVPAHIVEALERERIMPEVDDYGVRLSMKMSSDLYVLISNTRKEVFADRKNGRGKLVAIEEE